MIGLFSIFEVMVTHDYKHILYLYHIHDKQSSHNVVCALYITEFTI
jgi:hypothetical protein